MPKHKSGHILVGTKAPEVCLVCNHPQAYFEVREDNYKYMKEEICYEKYSNI